MATVHDVAAYIVGKQGHMTAMKLEKLVYYAQAWHLVWEGVPLFTEPIEAWMNGPVCPALYKRHRGSFEVTEWDGASGALTVEESSSVDAVLSYYGDWPPAKLSAQTHSEGPWRDARQGLGVTERGSSVIPLESMQAFYDAIANADD